MSSSAEYVGCAHEKFAKYFLPLPNRLFCCCYDTSFEVLVRPGAANQVPYWHLIGQLQAGVPQNQVAALFGVSPSTLSKRKAKLHITGDVKDIREVGREVGVPRRRHPKKTVSSPCQHLGAVGCLLQICTQGMQDDMADGSLPRQSGTDYTQPISGLIGLPGVLP